MKNGDKICTVKEVNFFYGGYNNNGYHIVYTSLKNFHINKSILQLPTKDDCKELYKNINNNKQ